MSRTISIRLQPLAGRKAAGQRRHDIRDPKHVPEYVDRDRIKDNSVIIAPPEPSALRAEIAAHRKAAGQQTLRADARTVAAGIITFGTDAQPTIEALTRDEQDRLYHRIADRIAGETGHDLVGLVVHRDESAPHAHFTLRGYKLDEAGKEQPLRLTPRDMSRLQDMAAAEVAGLGIERGKSKEQRIKDGEDYSKTVHKSVAELHRDLPKELEAARERLEKNEQLAEKARQDLEAQRGDAERVRKRMEIYEGRADKARAEIDALQDRVLAQLPADPPVRRTITGKKVVALDDVIHWGGQIVDHFIGKEQALEQRQTQLDEKEQRLDTREAVITRQAEQVQQKAASADRSLEIAQKRRRQLATVLGVDPDTADKLLAGAKSLGELVQAVQRHLQQHRPPPGKGTVER